jgi:nucleoside-diphosphate-sugar epimerase
MQKILITGASGFVGRVLCKQLIARNYQVRVLLRSESSYGHSCLCVDDRRGDSKNCELVYFKENNNDWNKILQNVDAVIHLAARVHIMHDTEKDPLSVFRKINVEWTKELANAAAANNVKRFIFMSSLHVNGNDSDGKPFQETDAPNPQTPYAISKLEAEQALREIALKTNLGLVIIRPPLVYGSNVKGNFLSLLNLVNKGIPFLPLGAFNNKRSLVGVNNLVDFLICCFENPKAANETFLISDDEDVTTTELIKLLMEYLGKVRPILPIPTKYLEMLAGLLGKKNAIKKMAAPLQIDISKAKILLQWSPKQSLKDGLRETVEWYKSI